MNVILLIGAVLLVLKASGAVSALPWWWVVTPFAVWLLAELIAHVVIAHRRRKPRRTP